MVMYVLDASAILRYLDDEAGADRIAAILKSHIAGESRIVVSDLHWGEVAEIICKRHSAEKMDDVMARLDTFGFESAPVTRERAVRAACIKARLDIPYSDALGVDLASDSEGRVLVTADFDVKPAAGQVRIEFLPVKQGHSG